MKHGENFKTPTGYSITLTKNFITPTGYSITLTLNFKTPTGYSITLTGNLKTPTGYSITFSIPFPSIPSFFISPHEQVATSSTANREALTPT